MYRLIFTTGKQRTIPLFLLHTTAGNDYASTPEKYSL